MSKKKELSPALKAECDAAKALFTSRKNALGLTQAKIAEAAEISPAAVAMYLNGQNPLNAKFAAVLSRLIGEPVEKFSPRLAEELRLMQSVVLPGAGSGTMEQRAAYVIPEASRLYRYPMVSSVAAGVWQDAIQPFEPGGEDVFELTDYKAKGLAFWLAVEGDSMTWSGSPSIPEGHLILVDTGLEAKPGDLVVAKLDTEDKATFKKLVRESGQLYLKPLNPAYAPIPVDAGCRIIGVVKEAKLKL